MVTKVLTVVLILLALGALYLLFHFLGKPPKKEEEVDYQPTPYGKDTIPLSTAIKNTADAMNKLGVSISEGLNPATVYCVPKPQGSKAKLNVIDDPAPRPEYILDWLESAKEPIAQHTAPRACALTEEMYDVITKNVPGFTGVTYPEPIFLSYYCDEELSQPPWLRYRDSKGRYIKKDLAMDLFNLRTAPAPYVQHQQQTFMVDYKIYRVSDRQ